MKTVGIVCEYNPLHLGHQHQMQLIRRHYGDDSAIVCVMSGNYVQRGAPAMFDKSIRAEAAVLAGADLVLELPIGACLSSAEGFAEGGIRIVGKICDAVSFGTESMTKENLFSAAEALNSEQFSSLLKEELSKGCSFPAARQTALQKILEDVQVPVLPNDILGTEYCKSILRNEFSLDVFPIHREGDYHDENLEGIFPSATAIRNAVIQNIPWQNAVPGPVRQLLSAAQVHTLQAGERAILYKLRTMSEQEFEQLPYGSEGLWRRLMHACHSGRNLDEIIALTKTKRYTRTRIDRMILCAFLGLSQEDLTTSAPYVRVLAFNDIGRQVLREKSDCIRFCNSGERTEDPYWVIEQRCGDLYGLFAAETEQPGAEQRRRIIYHSEKKK